MLDGVGSKQNKGLCNVSLFAWADMLLAALGLFHFNCFLFILTWNSETLIHSVGI